MDYRGKATTGSHLTPTFPPGRAPTWSILDGWKHYIDTFGRATQLDGANSEESTHTNLYCIHIINLRTWYQLPGHWKYPSHPTLSFSGELQTPLGTDHACLRPKTCQKKLSISRRDTIHGRKQSDDALCGKMRDLHPYFSGSCEVHFRILGSHARLIGSSHQTMAQISSLDPIIQVNILLLCHIRLY